MRLRHIEKTALPNLIITHSFFVIAMKALNEQNAVDQNSCFGYPKHIICKQKTMTMRPAILSDSQKQESLNKLHADWTLLADGNSIRREFKTKAFKQALSLTTLCGMLAEEQNHHPDISLGWGYCHITFTTHSASALTSLDIECAKKLDTLSACLFDAT